MTLDRACRDRRGVLMLAVMLLIILIGFSLIAAWPSKPTKVRRNREEDLKFKLQELRKSLNKALLAEESMPNDERVITALVYGPDKISYIYDKYDSYQESDTVEAKANVTIPAFVEWAIPPYLDDKTFEIATVAHFYDHPQTDKIPKELVGTLKYVNLPDDRWNLGQVGTDLRVTINKLRQWKMYDYLDREYGNYLTTITAADVEGTEKILIKELKERGYLRTDYRVPLLDGSISATTGQADDIRVAWRVGENLLTSSSFEEESVENPRTMEELKDVNTVRQYWFAKTANYELMHATTTMEPPPYDDYAGQKDNHNRDGKYGSRVLVLKLGQ